MRGGTAAGLAAWAAPWLWTVASAVVLAYLINSTLVGSFTLLAAGRADRATSVARDAAHLGAEEAVMCDPSSGRLMYVAAINECVPVEW